MDFFFGLIVGGVVCWFLLPRPKWAENLVDELIDKWRNRRGE